MHIDVVGVPALLLAFLLLQSSKLGIRTVAVTVQILSLLLFESAVAGVHALACVLINVVSKFFCVILILYLSCEFLPLLLLPSLLFLVRGVLGNKCAGQFNLKTVHFRETLASGNYLVWSSAIRVFFCSPRSTLGRRRQAFM